MGIAGVLMPSKWRLRRKRRTGGSKGRSKWVEEEEGEEEGEGEGGGAPAIALLTCMERSGGEVDEYRRAARIEKDRDGLQKKGQNTAFVMRACFKPTKLRLVLP